MIAETVSRRPPTVTVPPRVMPSAAAVAAPTATCPAAGGPPDRSGGSSAAGAPRTLTEDAAPPVLSLDMATPSGATEPTWQALSGAAGPTALAVDPGTADPAALDRAWNTTTVSRSDALAGIDGFSAEQGSLRLIQGFLFAVSALVIGAFFTVWTVQRGTDIAVLKAVGASSGYLVRDALAQALVLLLGGTLAGAATGLAGGVLLGVGGMPFAVGASTVAVPVLAMVLLGLAGAALAVRRITSVDPLTALGANR